MSVEECEQSCSSRLKEREKFYENLIPYLQTGKHVKGLQRSERQKVLRMSSSFNWDPVGKHMFVLMI